MMNSKETKVNLACSLAEGHRCNYYDLFVTVSQLAVGYVSHLSLCTTVCDAFVWRYHKLA
jgi:hypothetical protein